MAPRKTVVNPAVPTQASAQTVPAQLDARPSYLTQYQVPADDDFGEGFDSGPPVAILKLGNNGRFGVRFQGESGWSDADHFDVVLVQVQKAYGKQYYQGAYNPRQEEGKRPDCASADAKVSDPRSPHRQHEFCEQCPQNVFRKTPEGMKRPCRDMKRVAVVPADDIANSAYNGPMLLNLSWANATALKNYIAELGRSNDRPFMVVTRIIFDRQANYAQLIFSKVRYLTEAEFSLVMGWRDHEHTLRVLGENVEYEQPDDGVEPEPAPPPSPSWQEEAAPASDQYKGQAQPAPWQEEAAPAPAPSGGGMFKVQPRPDAGRANGGVAPGAQRGGQSAPPPAPRGPTFTVSGAQAVQAQAPAAQAPAAQAPAAQAPAAQAPAAQAPAAQAMRDIKHATTFEASPALMERLNKTAGHPGP